MYRIAGLSLHRNSFRSMTKKAADNTPCARRTTFDDLIFFALIAAARYEDLTSLPSIENTTSNISLAQSVRRCLAPRIATTSMRERSTAITITPHSSRSDVTVVKLQS
jgi:hypothetical protein